MKNYLIWLFVIIVSVFDVAFFWYNLDSVENWELNPVAVKLYQFGGFPLVAAVRLGTLGYLLFCVHIMSRHQPSKSYNVPFVDAIISKTSSNAVIIVGLVHAFLVLLYFWQN